MPTGPARKQSRSPQLRRRRNGLSFIFRLMMKAMGSPEGDFRDWEAIRAWAGQVRARLV